MERIIEVQCPVCEGKGSEFRIDNRTAKVIWLYDKACPKCYGSKFIKRPMTLEERVEELEDKVADLEEHHKWDLS